MALVTGSSGVTQHTRYKRTLYPWNQKWALRLEQWVE